MTGEAVVEVNDLIVDRGGTRAVRDLSFSIGSGEVTGLLGPSGCGKTTLMRAIVGVQIVASGSVTVLGLPAGHTKLRDRVGYVTQAPSVSVDLTEQQDRVVRDLSGGERSRVSLAVALLGEPRLLVLDEPTVGLDPVLRRDLWAMFHRLADTGVAVFVSSHVMDEAERCDRLLLMREGVLLADDSPAALLERTGASNVEHAFLALVEHGGVR